MEKFCSFLTSKLVQNKVIVIDDYNIYKYGFEALFSTLLGILTAFVIGLLTQRLLWVAVFFACFASLRSQCGGYHAKTVLRCKLSFGTAIFLNIFLTYLTRDMDMLFGLPLFVIGLGVIIALAPADREDKDMDQSEKRKHKILSLIIFALWTAAGVIMYFNAPEFFWVIGWAIFSASALLLFNYFYTRRKKHEA